MNKNSGLFVSFCMSLLLSSCVANFSVNRHPDYNFSPTDPLDIKIYAGGLLPTNKFIIIGQIIMQGNAFTDSKRSIKTLLEMAAKMGGDGILVSGSRISWMTYNNAVTQGNVNIYNFGYRTYADYLQQTTYYQTNVPTVTTYYTYVIRWLDEKNRPPSRFKLEMGGTYKGRVITVMSEREIEVEVSGATIRLSALPLRGGFSGISFGTAVVMIYISDKEIVLKYQSDKSEEKTVPCKRWTAKK